MQHSTQHSTQHSRHEATNGAILALDLSQRTSHIVLAIGDRILARAFEPASDATREVLWDELPALFADAHLEPHAIRAIAVTTGPGGFTGLRIAVAFAKSVGYALDVPVITLPSALVFAASDRARGGTGPWLVALASKAGTAWCATVRACPTGALVVSDASVDDGDHFSRRAGEVCAEGGSLLTDEHLDAALAVTAQTRGLVHRSITTDAHALIALARERLLSGSTENLYEIQPIYAREPEAVTKWRTLHGGSPESVR